MRASISLPVKLSISAAAVVLIVVHLWLPNLKTDSITLGLLALGVIPWLFDYVEKAKFPGGIEVKFRDIAQAGEQIVSAAPAMTNAVQPASSVNLPILERDPNLALVGLRIEIERRLVSLAEANKLPKRYPLTTLIRELSNAGYLPGSIANGLMELVIAGNHAAHGAEVDPAVADWAKANGSQIIAALDAVTQALEPAGAHTGSHVTT